MFWMVLVARVVLGSDWGHVQLLSEAVGITRTRELVVVFSGLGGWVKTVFLLGEGKNESVRNFSLAFLCEFALLRA